MRCWVLDTAMVFKFGQMEQNTEDTGKTTELTGQDASGMLMEINLKVNSKMTNQMAKELIPARMAQFTRVCGSTMCSMARARQFGQMVLVLQVTTRKVEKVDLELTAGLKATSTKVNGKRI